MSLEQKINYQLNKVPGVKKVIKRVYQRTMYAISPKFKSEGNIVRISPDDDNDTRCDLHPRWNHKGDKVCFDSVFEGHRGLYVVGLSDVLLPKLKEGEEKVEVNTPKYSIVTPMYNSFSLMKRYFASLCRQTCKNFEVIIVDDCSSDGSYEELCKYAEVSPLTIRVFKTEKNGGPGIARNIGMDAARGEWITFMVKAFAILEDELGSKYPEEIKEKSVTDILYGALLMMCKSGKSKKEIVAYIDSYEKKYPGWEQCEIIKHLGRAKETFLRMAKARNVLGMKAIAMVHSFLISRG